MISPLLALLLLSPLAQEAPPSPQDLKYSKPPRETVVPEKGATLPMESWGPRPILSAKVNGKGPYRFIVDTGSSLSVILDRGVAAEIGLEGGEDHEVAGLKGKGLALETLTIGTVEMTHIPAVVNDIGKYLPGPTAPVGILGIGLFADCLFTYDFPAKQFRIERGTLPESGATIVPYQYQGQIQFEIDVAGVKVPVHLDTGSPGTLTLTDAFEEKLPLMAAPVSAGQIRTPMGGASLRRATLAGTLELAGHEFANPSISFADLPPLVAAQVGNVGSTLLKEFAVTFDQKNKRLRFTKADPRSGK